MRLIFWGWEFWSSQISVSLVSGLQVFEFLEQPVFQEADSPMACSVPHDHFEFMASDIDIIIIIVIVIVNVIWQIQVEQYGVNMAWIPEHLQTHPNWARWSQYFQTWPNYGSILESSFILFPTAIHTSKQPANVPYMGLNSHKFSRNNLAVMHIRPY